MCKRIRARYRCIKSISKKKVTENDIRIVNARISESKSESMLECQERDDDDSHGNPAYPASQINALTLERMLFLCRIKNVETSNRLSTNLNNASYLELRIILANYQITFNNWTFCYKNIMSEIKFHDFILIKKVEYC